MELAYGYLERSVLAIPLDLTVYTLTDFSSRGVVGLRGRRDLLV